MNTIKHKIYNWLDNYQEIIIIFNIFFLRYFKNFIFNNPIPN